MEFLGQREDHSQFVKFSGVSRRRFLLGALFAAPCLAGADARLLEPGWVKTRRVRLASGKPTYRVLHFTDLHHKGDRAYLVSVVKKINGLSPDFVCFTGDLVEEKQYLAEALEILGGIKSPVYGVPGNHDYWSKVSFEDIARTFTATGGDWLLNRAVITRDRKISIFGAASLTLKHLPFGIDPARRNILLMHYPAWVKDLGLEKFDLILAGHSHGGQVRLPFYGPVVIPFGVDEYDLGLFRTRSGPLYVGAGIGWFTMPLRFNCRPEITLFEI